MPDTINSVSDQRNLTLLLAGLIPADEGEGTDGASMRLQWLLGRGDKTGDASWSNLDECLFKLFGADIPEGQDLPVAAVTRVLDMGVVDNAWWIRADPVHLAPHGDTLVMAASDDLDIVQSEADQLVQEILGVFSEDGWVLKAPRPNRWYLQPIDTPDISTTHINNVLGGNIYPALPTGPDGKKWHTILNELQILLHTAKVNTDRETKGQVPINSLWFWGGGRVPVLKESVWDCVWSNEPIGAGLARLAQVSHLDRPATAEHWLSEAESGNHVVILDQALRARLHGQQEVRRDFIDTLDEYWTEPLIRGLREKQITSLTVMFDNGCKFRVEANHLKRWWRRRKILGATN